AKTKGYKILALRGEVSQKNLGFWYTMHKGKKLRKSKEKSKYRESKKMHKKHIFLNVFQKIILFACVFCTISTWAETTTCDINYTPVTGNSIQNGTPTPTSPVEIESVGTKVGNKYQISVVAQGKNLFDKNNLYTDHYINSSGEIVSAPTWDISAKIPVIPNTQYTLSGVIQVYSGIYHAFYNSNDQCLLTITTAVGTTVMTAPANASYLRLSIRKASGDKDTVQLEQGSVATPYASYGHSTTPIYLNAPLRKVGDYADVLDYKNGTITRNVGVKVLDGTESWESNTAVAGLHHLPMNGVINSKSYCNYYPYGGTSAGSLSDKTFAAVGRASKSGLTIRDTDFPSTTEGNNALKAWLAQQYAAGTPVVIYYPLATPVVEQIENWSCIPPITDIQIATTKMVDEEFAAAEANLAATVQTIESVVSRTIAQTEQIATLQAEKQTRPDETCPANMKCLLVQDEDGTPHWYPIIEP
ncbi:MAG: hypothetical protein KBT14_02505, partial [Proteobacteria bacterium]|nr:hypothetical protein [Candidatus Enterousia onthequi]